MVAPSLRWPAGAWPGRLRRLGQTAVLLFVLLILQSAFWEPRVPWALALGIVALAGVSAFRPDLGLIAVAVAVPFGHVLVTSVWAAYPFALSEACVLAFLAGALGRDLVVPRRAGGPDALAVSAGLFAAIILASCLVQVAVLQVWHDYPAPFARALAAYFGREYLTSIGDPRPWVDGRGVVNAAVFMVEGLALLMYARRLAAENHAFGMRLAGAVVGAGAAAAALSVISLWSAAARDGVSIVSLMRRARWSFAIPSVNTSGPYFMLVAFLAVAQAVAAPACGRRMLWCGAAALSVFAMTLTHTRSSIVAGLALGLAALVWMSASRRLLPPVRTAALAGTLAVALAVIVVFVNPMGVLAGGAARSLWLRSESSLTAIRMTGAHPWFGVGIGQYALNAQVFMSPETFRLFPAPDAHNYFAWVAAELGVVGFAAFVGVIVSLLLAWWRCLRGYPRDGWFLAATAGIAAFIVTWIAGQPLAIPQAGYTFWIVAGATAGVAATRTGGARGVPRVAVRAAALTVLALVATVPFRTAQAAADVDRSRVSYGFFDWETDAAGARFRWSEGRATMFFRPGTRAVELPIAAARPPGTPPATVDIQVNGRLADRFVLAGTEQRRVRIIAPADVVDYWRIDLHTSPTWVPAEHVPGSRDDRALGVLVGELTVVPGA